MTWLTLPTTLGDTSLGTPWLLKPNTRSAPADRAGPTLGSAAAARDWRWAAEPVPCLAPIVPTSMAAALTRRGAAATPSRASVLRVPPALLRAMSAAAREHGLTESAVWAAAARAWLEGRTRDDEPQPPTPAGAALPVPPQTRSWAAIDTLLTDLRRPRVRTAPAA